MWDYRAKLISVHDGDTVTMLVDNGFHSRQEVKVRLYKVFAPELSQTGGTESRQFVVDWAKKWFVATLEWPFYLVTEKNTTTEPQAIETFARYVGKIWDINEKSCLNDEINAFLLSNPTWGHGVGG